MCDYGLEVDIPELVLTAELSQPQALAHTSWTVRPGSIATAAPAAVVVPPWLPRCNLHSGAHPDARSQGPGAGATGPDLCV